MSTFEIYYQSGLRNQFYRPIRVSRRQYRLISRFLDLVFSFLILPVLAIPMALIYLAIMIDSEGSPIFVQERVGYRGRHFKMYKFRTMRDNDCSDEYRDFMRAYIVGEISDADVGGDNVARYKPIRREDVTRVGRLLRKTSLDELPQIINVIKGDMSLIGPRPNVVWEVEAYRPWHYERLNAVPGITGLAQVMGRSDILFDDIARYDIQYARNQTLRLDLWIVGHTIKSIIGGNGAG
jgi:lipopolysaccharide/colanic/teichoic acid biosynthesis glycosyltransferase